VSNSRFDAENVDRRLGTIDNFDVDLTSLMHQSFKYARVSVRFVDTFAKRKRIADKTYSPHALCRWTHFPIPHSKAIAPILNTEIMAFA